MNSITVTLSPDQENAIVDALARRYPGGGLVLASTLQVLHDAHAPRTGRARDLADILTDLREARTRSAAIDLHHELEDTLRARLTAASIIRRPAQRDTDKIRDLLTGLRDAAAADVPIWAEDVDKLAGLVGDLITEAIRQPEPRKQGRKQPGRPPAGTLLLGQLRDSLGIGEPE